MRDSTNEVLAIFDDDILIEELKYQLFVENEEPDAETMSGGGGGGGGGR